MFSCMFLLHMLVKLKLPNDICGSVHSWKIVLFISGQFSVKPDKKSAPVTKTAKKVGMIAGGTGQLLSRVCV